MFCDMEGFTSLSDKLESEEAFFHDRQSLRDTVRAYEGTVNEMTGDGLRPISAEDQARYWLSRKHSGAVYWSWGITG